MEKPLVSITKAAKIHDFDSVDKAVRKSVALAGGLESLVVRGDLVLIKPNVLYKLDYKTGAITNPNVVRSLIRIAKEAGAKKVVIAEGSIIGCSTAVAFKESGYDKLAEEENVELIDLKKADAVYIGIPNGKIFRRLEIPEIILKADVIINVPVMKTHDITPATLGLKNMKGVIKDQDKKRFHILGVGQSIVDLNKLVLPHLTVIDATVGMEGVGPLDGEPVNLGLIISSFDTVAADTVGLSIMDIDPKEVNYMPLAAEQGLGCNNLSNIDVVGKTIAEVKHPFKVVKVDFKEFEKKYGIRIIESGACTGCRHMVSALIAYYIKGNVDVLKDCTIIFGQNIKMPSDVKGRLICLGACTKKYKDQGEYVPGCPPFQEHMVKLHLGAPYVTKYPTGHLD